MSTLIPEKLSHEQSSHLFNVMRDQGLTQYSNLVRQSYRKERENGNSSYTLKENIPEPDLAWLDYVFRRLAKEQPFDSLEQLALYLRMLSDDKKHILLFAYNGTGKTRLSAAFKTLGQRTDPETGVKTADTLYYNAFTEDLFHWDNDLENDTDRYLLLNRDSRFFSGLAELEMENRIRPILHRYADFDFTIDYDEYRISFYRGAAAGSAGRRDENIKVSRGEENLFIWCFFLAIVQLVIDKAESYSWVHYIYIDDPISSLDDNNAVALANHLAALMQEPDIRVIVSTHHVLFYNVLCNELKNSVQLFFRKQADLYLIKDTGKTPTFYHIAMLQELKRAADTGKLYPYHFNILRSILEKTASFYGYRDFSACLRKGPDTDETVHHRMIQLLSHGNYSVFQPKEMVEENKEYFRTILDDFLNDYKFNRALFAAVPAQEDDQ